MRAVLAEALDSEGQGGERELELGAGGVVKIFENEAAGGHAAQGPGADTAGDVGFLAPAGLKGQREGERLAVALDFGREASLGRSAVEHPGDVRDGDERLLLECLEEVAGLDARLLSGGSGGDLLDAKSVRSGQGEADGLGSGHRVDEVLRDGTIGVAMHRAKGVADLVAVDAAFDDVSLPVELAAVALGERGDLDGGAERDGAALLAGKGVLVGWVSAVEREGALKSATVGFETGVLGVFLVLPGAVATVEGAVGVENEGGEGEVVVELEELEVDGVGIDEADADELVEQGGQAFILEDCGVHAHAGEARDAAEDDEKGFARTGGLGEAALEVVVDPAFVVFHFGTIATHGAFAVFDGFSRSVGGGEEEQRGQRQEGGGASLHGGMVKGNPREW